MMRSVKVRSAAAVSTAMPCSVLTGYSCKTPHYRGDMMRSGRRRVCVPSRALPPTVTPDEYNAVAVAVDHLSNEVLPVIARSGGGGSSSGGALVSLFKPAADFFTSLGTPSWLIKYGHPGNMFVVLTAMGGYGAYLGWQLRLPKLTTGNGKTMSRKDKGEMHAQLMIGMTIFFLLGASGGLMSEVMQGRPLLSSPHSTTAFIGLLLLSFQACLPLAFEEQPELRTAHAYFGSAIMAVFLLHASLGIKLATEL